MSEILMLRRNELCSLREKLRNLRDQREVILANEDLKNGGKGKKAEEALEYCDAQLLTNRQTLERKLSEFNTVLEQKLSVVEQKQRALSDEYDRKKQKLEEEYEARCALLELECVKLRQKNETDRAKAESVSESYEAYLETLKKSKESALFTSNEIKSAATLSLDKQIRELEQKELFAASVVDMCVRQMEAYTKPYVPYHNPIPLPHDPEEEELARLRADARREVADRKSAFESPYGPTEREYRKHS